MPSASTEQPPKSRFFVGIGVGTYDDPDLNLERAESDVSEVADWFSRQCGISHRWELRHLAESPTTHRILRDLREFMLARTQDDVIVIYMACHGELEGATTYLFGRDTPRESLAGLAIGGATLGELLGQSAPHNVLLIIDACVAGRLGSAIQRAAEDKSDELNNREPRGYAQVVVASTFGRDPAYDGRFTEAFLRVVNDERWTGTATRWIGIDQLIGGLNHELTDISPTQIAERRVWGTAAAELIPNPNYGSRHLVGLIADEEFAAHFDPMSRGVAHGEKGTFFTGRDAELGRIVEWLEAFSSGSTPGRAQMLVITGSPGSGKSALLARAVVLGDPERRPADHVLATLPAATVPHAGAFDGVVWCHNKTTHQIIGELAAVLGGTATTSAALLHLAAERHAIIAIDALDEALGDEAVTIASQVLRPLSETSGVRLLVATRRRPVHGRAGRADLLEHLGPRADATIDLDRAPHRHEDMRRYVAARISATTGAAQIPDVDAFAGRIVEAAGNSFLVASIAARSAWRNTSEELQLPSEVGAALASYIERLPRPAEARSLLRPLAWARGAGLPWGPLWPALATALVRVESPGSDPLNDDMVSNVLETAGDVIVESIQSSQPVYRLFHEALAEHLRSDTDARAAHDAIATVMRDHVAGRPWTQVDPYVRAHLPAHLLGAARYDELVELLTDPAWDRNRREQTGDPLAAVTDARAAIESLLESDPNDLRVVPICVAHSRAMATAPPLIIEVLARSGQPARARMMAANLADAHDRVLAFRLLADVYARAGDREAARHCVEEVARAGIAMPPTHQSMARCYLAKAAVDAGLPEEARDAARSAVDAALTLEGDGWDVANALFWAALACRTVADEEGLATVRATLDTDNVLIHRNQPLQAAAVAGHHDLLQRHLAAMRDGERHPVWPVRDGNLALALADAGLQDEVSEVIAIVGDEPPRGEADSRKRWAWAMALSGRMKEAIAALDHIHDAIEESKAIARIAKVADERGEQETLDVLATRSSELLTGAEPSARPRLIRVLWRASRNEQALSYAEDAITAQYAPAFRADLRAGATAYRSDPATSIEPTSRPSSNLKTGRRQLVTSVVPVTDQEQSQRATSASENGDIDTALLAIEGIDVPLFRARALGAVARFHPIPEKRLAYWLQAMAQAQLAGRAAIDEILPIGAEILRGTGRDRDLEMLQGQLTELDARWDMESFAEQYAALRRGLPSGWERTRRMTVLMLTPQRLASARTWSSVEVRNAWLSGDDGKRLFALGLIQGDPTLADADVLVEAIRGSRTAFEQFHALAAARRCNLPADQTTAIRNAVQAEVDGEPRPDGTDPHLTGTSDRMPLARELLSREG